MKLFTIEQSKIAYWADFAFYGATIVMLSLVLMVASPHAMWAKCTCLAIAGVVAWSALEYVVHRFLFHGMQPFRRWHAEHHARPAALIGTPTIFTAALLGALLFLPTWAIDDAWGACALTLGVVCGYFAYASTHHAIHHWRARGAWLRRRQRWHFIHHHARHPCCYGVTSGIWDASFGSGPPSLPEHARSARNRAARALQI
jgi:cyclopropane-fatty-acyl-phospholipid synthase